MQSSYNATDFRNIGMVGYNHRKSCKTKYYDIKELQENVQKAK